MQMQMNKLAISKLIKQMNQKSILLKMDNPDRMILLLLYLFDWKYILVYGHSVLNIKWKIVNGSVTFNEFDILNAEAQYSDFSFESGDPVCIAKQCNNIWRFVSSTLDKYPEYMQLLILVKSTYPLTINKNHDKCFINLEEISIEYKESLFSDERAVVSSTNASFMSKAVSMIAHYYHKIMNINFTNISQLYKTIEELKADINIYKYDYNTGLMTRHDLMIRLNILFDNKCDFTLIMYDVNGLHTVNRIDGYRAGDQLIVDTSKHIKALSGHHESYTTGGDEFFVIYENNADVPDDISIPKCCHGAETAFNASTVSELIDIVDRKVSDKKRKIKKRRDDI